MYSERQKSLGRRLIAALMIAAIAAQSLVAQLPQPPGQKGLSTGYSIALKALKRARISALSQGLRAGKLPELGDFDAILAASQGEGTPPISGHGGSDCWLCSASCCSLVGVLPADPVAAPVRYTVSLRHRDYANWGVPPVKRDLSRGAMPRAPPFYS